jgi:hypothetical protein
VTLAPAQELTTLFLSSTFPASLAAYLVFLSGRVWFDRNRANLSSSVSAALSWWDDSLHVRAITYATIALVILGFAPGKIAPFIYFQF